MNNSIQVPIPAPRPLQRLQLAILVLVLLAGFGVRMVNLTNPPLDFNMVRQLRSAILARAVYYNLDPQIDPQTRILANDVAILEDYEPPIIEQITGLTYFLTGGENVWVGRIYSCLFWLIGGLALFLTARRFASFWPSLLGLAFYLCLPFGIVASRAFMPEPWMMMWIMVTAYLALCWCDKPDWKNSLLTGVVAGITILVKVTAGFFVAGVLVLLVLDTLGIKKAFRSLKVWVMAILSLAPAVIYYIGLHGSGASSYFAYNTLEMFGLVTTSKFYTQWLAQINQFVGLTALVGALIGVILAPDRLRLALIGLWIGYVGYGFMWPFQFTTHDYYHLSLVPLVGLSIVPLVEVVLQKLSEQRWIWRAAGIAVILLTFGWQLWVGRSILVARDYRGEPGPWQKMGEAIPQGASFVALVSDYGFRLEYYGMRRPSSFWPAGVELAAAKDRGQPDLDVQSTFNAIAQGKMYFLVASPDDYESQGGLRQLLTEHYPVYSQGDGYILFDLMHPK